MIYINYKQISCNKNYDFTLDAIVNIDTLNDQILEYNNFINTNSKYSRYELDYDVSKSKFKSQHITRNIQYDVRDISK